MDATTAAQIARLRLKADKPLLICDVDEVVLHFVRGFEEFLAGQGFWLDPRSYEFEGNVRRRSDGSIIDDAALNGLLQRFFAARIGALEPVEGAAEALSRLAADWQVVLLTNLPHMHYEARAANLARHGMTFPLITNSGPKGPAVRALAAPCREPCVFVDDYTDFLDSARAHHPDIALVHFLHDPRFAPHARKVHSPHVRASHWREAEQAVKSHLAPAASAEAPRTGKDGVRRRG